MAASRSMTSFRASACALGPAIASVPDAETCRSLFRLAAGRSGLGGVWECGLHKLAFGRPASAEDATRASSPQFIAKERHQWCLSLKCHDSGFYCTPRDSARFGVFGASRFAIRTTLPANLIQKALMFMFRINGSISAPVGVENNLPSRIQPYTAHR